MWNKVLEWVLTALSKIGEFANWLFTPITASDAIAMQGSLIVKPFVSNSTFQTIVDTLRNFFHEKVNFLDNISFTPIALLSVTGLVIVIFVGVLDKLNLFN